MMGELWRRLMFLLHRREFEQSLEDEMRFHREMTGARKFGNVALLKEDSRNMWGFGSVDRLWQDARYAVRMLRKSPGFTAVAILSLALGIGANTAIFSLINAVLLRSLAVHDPEQLVSLSRSNLRRKAMSSFPYPLYRELRDHSEIFSAVLCWAGMFPTLSVRGSSERVTGEMVSGSYFQTLGIQPYAGRLFRPDDEGAPGAGRVAVLSYGFWKRRFAADPAVVGTVIHLNTIPMTVIGIAPPGFNSLNVGVAPDVRVPITMQPEMYAAPSMLESRGDWWLTIVGRLKPGITPAQAESAVTAFTRAYMDRNDNGQPRSEYARRVFASEHVSLLPAGKGLQSQATKAAKQLFVLMAIVGVVLLIACVNLANLLLARTAARRREIAVRLALGAGRARLVRQLLTESVLLAGAGGLCGILFAHWGARLLLAFLLAGQRGAALDLAPDGRMLAFTVGISIATGLLFGLAPALQSTRFQLTPELKGDQQPLPGTRIAWRKALVSAQVGLSLLLLIGAGLFLRSLNNLQTMDTGFDKDKVLQASMNPTLSGYEPARIRPFYREVLARVSALPGVRAASLASVGLIASSSWGSGITVEGYQTKEGDSGPERNIVGPGYFTALRVPILQGRDFGAQDSQNAPHVAIVNEKFARFYFGNENPLGKHIGPGGKQGAADFAIVGVVKDGKYANLREETLRLWYIPYEQYRSVQGLTLYVRASGDPLKMADAVRRAVRSIDANVPIYDVKTLAEQIDENIAVDRMVATLSGFFSILAALIAAIGLYGVMTYSVTRRTREIGIRMALGAQQAMVVRSVMAEVGLLAVVGIALAVPCALALGRFVASLLYEVKPADKITLVAASVLMGGVAIIAGYLPARRASRVDPMVALRWD